MAFDKTFKNAEPDVSKNVLVRFISSRFNITDSHHGERFFVKQAHPRTGRTVWFITPLFMDLVLIEVADVIFAVDSVPPIFAITTDPFIVYTANIFAILGLRALYFALAAMIHRFKYLEPALALVLVFIGSKIFIADMLGLEKPPPLCRSASPFAIIASGVAWSLLKTRTNPSALNTLGAPPPETNRRNVKMFSEIVASIFSMLLIAPLQDEVAALVAAAKAPTEITRASLC
ncbi:TerC family integral membrane protein [Rhizobium lentis]|uniref:TerC family integral membrane protein n=1 Tax=Rhizobium lentis TaxID=1138194 RepID=A0A7W9CYH4_9HYPH|nr:TerC family integral membrane protein [Rhizobium lentis]MBB5554041.1 TerC family integral membrane protein [Rhizobium lentis]MBB5564599.1 TerC family integral membrane protein [Rhizobium lentis]MBB5571153.1 TerC family integral membrane protein [Rhizobium lentis]